MREEKFKTWQLRLIILRNRLKPASGWAWRRLGCRLPRLPARCWFARARPTGSTSLCRGSFISIRFYCWPVALRCEVARRRVASFMGGPAGKVAVPLGWLYATLALGLLFVAGQYEAWLQLRARGFYLPTNPSSSFFYVLTAVHVLHVLGGSGRAGSRHPQTQASELAPQHAGCDLALLAFHGHSLAVPAFDSLDEILNIMHFAVAC